MARRRYHRFAQRVKKRAIPSETGVFCEIRIASVPVGTDRVEAALGRETKARARKVDDAPVSHDE